MCSGIPMHLYQFRQGRWNQVHSRNEVSEMLAERGPSAQRSHFTSPHIFAIGSSALQAIGHEKCDIFLEILISIVVRPIKAHE